VTTKAPWPRQIQDTIVDKAFGPDGEPAFRWYVSSRSTPGAFRRVTFHKSGTVQWFTCSGPCGRWDETKMGSTFERGCSHLRSVLAAEQLDGFEARPVAPPHVSALTD
jgi:hypothetical protein